MNAKPVSSIEKLLRASSDDERALEFPLPDSGFGFHAQQAVEKLYKCLLFSRQGTFPFSHDLHALRLRVEAHGVSLPSCSFRLEELSEYAANARHDDPIPVDEPTRQTVRVCIADLRRFVLTQVDSSSLEQR